MFSMGSMEKGVTKLSVAQSLPLPWKPVLLGRESETGTTQAAAGAEVMLR